MTQVCDPIALQCVTCYEITLTQSSVINVAAGLTPAATYYLWITDKFGNQYRDQVTVHGDGSFDITASNYPSGMFNANAGKFNLFISSDINGVNKIAMHFSMVSYNCLIFAITCP